jgi:urease accessory protein
MSLKTGYQYLLAALLLLIAPLAAAHTGLHSGSGLVDGFMHPATGIDHLLVTLAAGYWAARSGDHGLRGQLLFIVLFVLGIVLGIAGARLLHVDLTTLLPLLLAALVIAVAIGNTHYFLHALFGSLALYHGVLHMAGMPAGVPLSGYAAGLLLATVVLLMVGQIIRQVIITRRPHSVR